jgi:hypothetical protein
MTSYRYSGVFSDLVPEIEQLFLEGNSVSQIVAALSERSYDGAALSATMTRHILIRNGLFDPHGQKVRALEERVAALEAIVEEMKASAPVSETAQ